MTAEVPTCFADLLKEHRLVAGLTQELLADRGGVSERTIQALERGESKPQRETARRLAVALALTGEQRRAFEALAQPDPRRRASAAGSGARPVREATPWGTATHNLPVHLTSFIGREREQGEVR
ncbi:MAG TPA: helix-turn-helix transcriptional regulator, partial [Chloroflexota bacterium]|nr:helix-turn-helix transcriptional regulator [Chloroflexota bacterium]